jgi:hypothetical protein
VASIEDLNRELDHEAARGAASEDFLLKRLELLSGRGLGDQRGFWPTLARLAELTLFSAGCLALAGEFAACGDLLFNPGGKLLHIKGSPRPLALKRRRALTRQAAHLVPAGRRTIDWLKERTILEVPHKALLPRLRDKLEGWTRRPGGYLDTLDREFEMLASSMVLMMGLGSGLSAGLPAALAGLPRRDRLWLEGRIYRPDLQRFHQLGRRVAGDGRGG